MSGGSGAESSKVSCIAVATKELQKCGLPFDVVLLVLNDAFSELEALCRKCDPNWRCEVCHTCLRCASSVYHIYTSLCSKCRDAGWVDFEREKEKKVKCKF